ncbi:unnamed protein product [Microthlaspi erraticum]|uniref:Uncharacterized protein n=1 Tax=Microthlaspi erraticum TaxID=1685480 RepID=A0A6D2J3V2_9BRAS|nr:unnamed protein product [Microthlaspi erraticum]
MAPFSTKLHLNSSLCRTVTVLFLAELYHSSSPCRAHPSAKLIPPPSSSSCRAHLPTELISMPCSSPCRSHLLAELISLAVLISLPSSSPCRANLSAELISLLKCDSSSFYTELHHASSF